MLLYPITNEVIPQRVFPALLFLSDLYKIKAFAAKEDNNSIFGRIDDEISKRSQYPTQWRAKHTETEIKSLYLIKDMLENQWKYHKIDYNNCNLPQQAYNNQNNNDFCVFIGTNNLTHIPYSLDACKNNANFIVEKPLVVNSQDLGLANQVNGQIKSKNLVAMVTSHFAYKPATMMLLEKIDTMINEYGQIKKFNAFYEELDDPNKPRTQATLNKQISGCGIFGDTGSHIEMILMLLGGEINSTPLVEIDSFKGYNVETYCHVKHELKPNKRFCGSNDKPPEAEITVGKFVNMYIDGNGKENKRIELFFEKGQKAELLFSEHKINVYENNKLIKEFINQKYNTNEYVNILLEFYDCIKNERLRLTDFEKGIKVSEIILNTLSGNNVGRIRKYI